MKPKLLIHANDKSESQVIKQKLIEGLQGRNIELLEKDCPDADFIISIGGDGTFLSTFHYFQDHLSTARFLGIHTGHLGFYTDWIQEDIETIIDNIEMNVADSVSYPLLDIELTLEDGQVKKIMALNEFTFRSSSGTMVLDVFIKDYFFETFRGDGVCVSTPTGSTGLNKSLGGAVIHPRIDAIQLTEMASINNRVYRTLGSPMIIPKDEWIVLIPKEKNLGYITIDHENWQNINFSKALLKVSQQRIQFAIFKHTHFWDRVEKAFIGINQNK